jgi:chromosome segregation ATPase
MAKDADVLDAAISAIETLHRNLWSWRAMVKELGDVKTQYDGTKSGLEVLRQQADQVSAQLEATRTELADTQNQNVELKKENVALAAEVAEKERMLRAYSETIDRITGAAA